MSVPSIRGNGTHGHLALIISPADYLVLSPDAPFIPPVHHGSAPVHAPGATSAQITETNRQFKADTIKFNIYTSIEANLKKLLLQAVPATYIDELRDDIYSFANVRTLTILAHLDTTYGQISSDDLDANLEDLHRTWNSSQPIEDLWHQIRACRLFADDIDPISELTAIRTALLNLEKTVLFTDVLKDWCKRPEVEHTLANLKSDFNRADKERHRSTTIRDAGFAGAASTSCATAANDSPAPTLPPATTSDPGLSGLHYCWSHGLGPNVSHTSASCRTKLPGHRDDATANNMLGGCNTIHRRHGEHAAPRAPAPPPPEA
jgi:hypothetical protein